MDENMKAVYRYFDELVMPMIRKCHPGLADDMSILVLGSAGLGIADEWSDLEAAVYLPEKLWREQGASLQLSLNRLVSEQNVWKKEGSVLCVHPLDWLLDGQGAKIAALPASPGDCGNTGGGKKLREEAASTGTCADGSSIIPWEEISVEALFTMQENLIYYDPRGLLGRVRALTAPENYPDRLWKKSLLAALRELREGMHDLRQDVRRGRFSEAQLHLGRVVEHLFHTGFLAMHRYYPWHTHLRWAWDRLEPAVPELGRGLERLEQSAGWSERLEAAGEIFDALREYITRAEVFPEIDLYSGNLEQEITWAERLAAWDNPGWRDFIRDKMDRAVAAGYPPDQFWVWSLWGLE